MKIRAFATVAAALVVLLGPPASAGAAGAAHAPAPALVSTLDDGTVPDDTTGPTFNEFLPEERPLSDCLGALQRPNCGSEARGGWGQTAVFVAILAGLAFIAWRIVATSRRARGQAAGAGGGAGDVTQGTPDATSAPDGAGGDPAP